MSMIDGRNVSSTSARLQDIVPLADFLHQHDDPRLLSDRPETLVQKQVVVDQAIRLLGGVYVHLPLKRARHAVNPLERLEALRHRLPEVSERTFHRQMMDIFKDLRDAHTSYGRPAPFRSAVAFLPFRMKVFWKDDQRRFLVTRTLSDFDLESFGPGAEVVSWNGLPTEWAVERNAEREAGNNDAARFAFGLASMTVRPLTFTPPPNDARVIIGFRLSHDSEEIEREILLPWSVWTGGKKELFPEEEDGTDEHSDDVSVVTRAGMSNEFQKMAYAVRKSEPEWRSKLDDIFEFRLAPYPGAGPFGYIRIRKFKHDSRTQFIEEFLRIIEIMNGKAPAGLILDVRGNPGGNIRLGESILQFLTPRKITPEPFQFIQTPAVRELCSELKTDPKQENLKSMVARSQRKILARDWGKRLTSAGCCFSQSAPLTSHEDANKYGQRYYGPCVLLIDGLCYSTTDIFAAGFQDHEIGPVIGTDEATGAGGANVWKQSKLADLLLSGCEALEDGTTMRVSIRRSTRVGRHRGDLLEDFGVQADCVHKVTRDDVSKGNPDLIRHACQHLASAGPHCNLWAEVTEFKTRIEIRFSSEGLLRLEFHLNGRPQESLAVDSPKGTLTINFQEALVEGEAPKTIVVKGYEHTPSGWRLRAVRKVAKSDRKSWMVIRDD